jgi:hypothetical protein
MEEDFKLLSSIMSFSLAEKSFEWETPRRKEGVYVRFTPKKYELFIKPKLIFHS